MREVGHFNQVSARALGVTVREHWSGNELTAQAEVEAYVCTECGYFEEYVARPREVPWEKLRDFEWVPGPGAPFR